MDTTIDAIFLATSLVVWVGVWVLASSVVVARSNLIFSTDCCAPNLFTRVLQKVQISSMFAAVFSPSTLVRLQPPALRLHNDRLLVLRLFRLDRFFLQMKGNDG